ncbi:uncharacterized protein C8R40DRAFT_1039807, partial [Lentinula edodes]|uniref:uncharacterized protein n=1 Tax=Lentinula edodes TaxID=5353 RepID=UPI001E8ECA6C
MYIGLSSTYDYTHRPKQHEVYNLYDWILTFHRIKRSRRAKKKEPNVSGDESESEISTNQSHELNLPFLSGHPLSSSHTVAMRRNIDRVIPNFIGPPLPRPDKEDREYYCCAMLTFFKPWRSGADLKGPAESWHDAFTSHSFTDCENLYIKNMNLRYECLDSRDDFRQKMKEGNAVSSLANALPFNLDCIDD